MLPPRSQQAGDNTGAIAEGVTPVCLIGHGRAANPEKNGHHVLASRLGIRTMHGRHGAPGDAWRPRRFDPKPAKADAPVAAVTVGNAALREDQGRL